MNKKHPDNLIRILPKIPMGKEARPSWDSYFMMLAKLAASRSTCLSRPTGAIIVRDKRVLATGYNGALVGRIDCLSEGICYRRAHKISEGENDKYEECRSSHAEKNAIAYASRSGISIDKSTMYVTLYPCIDCAKLIIASGIKEVVYEKGYDSGKKGRDKLWKKFLEEDTIVRQHKIPKKEIQYILPFLTNITSERRLAPTD